MGKIQLLNDQLIGKIAAGEVVERPAAAIKELVENSLDAGATSITIEIHQDPTDYMRVTDNGHGIETADIRMAFERHATSKIHQEKDLDAIATMGFRGEALASISAVSRMTMVTRVKQDDAGIRVLNEGGVIRDIQEQACPVGTSMIVRDLFYNTPVRRGFLRKTSAEVQSIFEVVSSAILSRPDVSFRLISAGKTIYHSTGDGTLASAVLAVFGRQALMEMREVRGSQLGVLVEGYVGIGELARSTRSGEHFFVNHRMMKSLALSAALENACRERVMIGRFPMCVLNLTMPYEEVNVNVHPNKMEVRFRREKEVCTALSDAVLDALRERDAFEKPLEMHLNEEAPAEQKNNAPVQPVDADEIRKRLQARDTQISTVQSVPPVPAQSGEKGRTEQPADKPVLRFSEPEQGAPGFSLRNVPSSSPAPVRQAASPSSPPPVETEQASNARDQAPSEEEKSFTPEVLEKAEQISALVEKKDIRPMRVFGAVFDTFILIEYADHLLLVDQHAVHERLLFDRLMQSYGTEKMGQELLVPFTLSVTQHEMALFQENQSLLEGIGLRAEPFGEHDLAVRSLPVVLGDIQPVAFLREILGDLESGRAPTFEKKRTVLLQSACKHAIKGGEKLSDDLLRDLVEQMIDRRVTPTCPHGRPLVVSISHLELDKKFKRIQT